MNVWYIEAAIADDTGDVDGNDDGNDGDNLLAAGMSIRTCLIIRLLCHNDDFHHSSLWLTPDPTDSLDVVSSTLRSTESHAHSNRQHVSYSWVMAFRIWAVSRPRIPTGISAFRIIWHSSIRASLIIRLLHSSPLQKNILRLSFLFLPQRPLINAPKHSSSLRAITGEFLFRSPFVLCDEEAFHTNSTFYCALLKF